MENGLNVSMIYIRDVRLAVVPRNQLVCSNPAFATAKNVAAVSREIILLISR